MSSIRPLITLTIIVIAGVFLFRKINEGPAHVPHGGTETFQSSAVESAPPLAVTPPGTTTSGAPAPAWTGGTTATEPAAPQWADSVTENTTPGIPPISATPSESESAPKVSDAYAEAESASPAGVPPIPALPPLAEATPPAEAMQSTAAMTPSAPTESIEPPASIPTARYLSDTSDAESATPPPTTTPFNTTADNAPLTTEPAAPAAEAIAPEDRYGAPMAEAGQLSQPASPLAANWPEIQTALDRQELAQAHQMLSEFYGNPALSPTEAQQVETLLSQLAGTVVYSTEHRLEPPYVVHPGDTLETIAQKYEVPWQLLAKINGIPAADLVQPGQELKVIHGPFSAVVELGKSQLTLMLGDRYAGHFPIITEPAATMAEGQWTLEQKLVNPPSTADGVVSASYDASTPAVDRLLVLRNESPQAGGATISIASGTSTPSGPAAIAPAAIRISPRDAEELADILSVGSRVTIRK